MTPDQPRLGGEREAPHSVAVRIRDVGRYFGPRVEMDGVAKPREAFRSLMRIAGVNVAADDADPQVTFAAPGHVLRQVSLDITRGSVVCLTGASGAGKSLLLKILAGAVAPTSGRVEIFGPLTALLSVGDNLNPNLTAHENIEAVSLGAGASPEDAAAFMQEVLDFAELHGFEHSAIRTFSTGMVLRLSIALALSGRHSIVLIDDVLAVGDIGFRQKCIDRLRALKEQGLTLLLVVTDEDLVQQLATRVIVLANGKVAGDTTPGRVTASTAGVAPDVEWQIVSTLPEDDVLALRTLRAEPVTDGDARLLEFEAVLFVKAGGMRCRPLVAISNPRTVLFRSLYPEFVPVASPGMLRFTVRVPIDILPNGDYTIGFSIASLQGPSVYALKAHDAVKLLVRRDGTPGAPDAAQPALMLPVPWEVEHVMGGAA